MDYSREVAHTDRLIVRGAQPFNAEPPASTLVEFKYTPEDLIYCRNHGPVEEYDEDSYLVTIDGLVSNPTKLSISTLRSNFGIVDVVAALQCAGNRRKEMAAIKKVKGIIWDNGVIANCRWRGVRLRDVLTHAGVETLSQEGKHVCFASHATPCQDDSYYGGSIPLSRALDPDADVLLALDMNGQTLSPDHGYPLRVVVPGVTGARWVKWVDQITVASEESPNFYQQRDYRILPPHVETAEQARPYWPKIASIQSLPVNSIIASVVSDVASPEEKILVKGYAMGAGGLDGQIANVQVSADDGTTWQDARITYQEGKWSWTLWACSLDIAEAKTILPKGQELKLLCRAQDAKGEMQQRECAWNFRGVAFNAYGTGVWQI